MDDNEIIERLTFIYVDGPGDGYVTMEQAAAFLKMYREMQEIDREIAEEERVAHAREMSKPRR